MPSSLYLPDAAAEPVKPYNISILSSRDVALQVPINFVTAPGVSITAACFATNSYNRTSAAKCMSNLLAAGYRRLVVDVFWDVSRSEWSLCPVQIAPEQPSSQTGGSVPPTSSGNGTTVLRSSVSASGSGLRETSSAVSTQSITIQARQTTSSVTLSVTPTTQNSQSASLPASSTSSAAANTVVNVGPYACESDTNVAMLVSLLDDYCSASQYNVNATLKYIVLNTHAAASASDPNGPAPTVESDQLPTGSNALGNLFYNKLSPYLYTPNQLALDRQNLNSSWLTAEDQHSAIEFFFTTNTSNGVLSSPDGWPGENYVEFSSKLRLLVGFGHVDAQISAYHSDADDGYIFGPGVLYDTVAMQYASNGSVLSGCIFDPAAHDVSHVNSSFAVAGNLPNSIDEASHSSVASLLANAVGNVTACGISSYLDQTIANVTADVDVRPYVEFAHSMIWSWAPGEPLDDASARTGGSVEGQSQAGFRCAVLDPQLSGHWRVEYCQATHRSACRQVDQPYTWSISSSESHYMGASDEGCPSNFDFAVPRTALENSYLLQAFRDWNASERADGDDTVIWINLNSLDVESCWVSGVNITCPYGPMGRSETAEIIIPTVAAIIVFILTILTLLVKCGANRQHSRRKRRFLGGWDYEGVPS